MGLNEGAVGTGYPEFLNADRPSYRWPAAHEEAFHPEEIAQVDAAPKYVT